MSDDSKPPIVDDPIADATKALAPEIDEPDVKDLLDEEEPDEDTLNGQYLDDVSDDSVRLYLREIGKIPLLNSEDELTLAQEIVANREELEEVNAKLKDESTTPAERRS